MNLLPLVGAHKELGRLDAVLYVLFQILSIGVHLLVSVETGAVERIGRAGTLLLDSDLGVRVVLHHGNSTELLVIRDNSLEQLFCPPKLGRIGVCDSLGRVLVEGNEALE